MKARKPQLLRELTRMGKMEEKQTIAVNTEGSRDHSSSKVSVFCVLFALTYMYMMCFSLSIVIHLGLEKNRADIPGV